MISLGVGVPVIGALSDHVYKGAANGLGLSLFTAIGALAVIGVCIGVIARPHVAKAAA
jgi:hypothetical protein